MTIHDHFDGSAHCVECAGRCKLTGEDLAITEYIRFTMESLAHRGFTAVPIMWRQPLSDLGLSPQELLDRAIQTGPYQFRKPPPTGNPTGLTEA